MRLVLVTGHLYYIVLNYRHPSLGTYLFSLVPMTEFQVARMRILLLFSFLVIIGMVMMKIPIFLCTIHVIELDLKYFFQWNKTPLVLVLCQQTIVFF